MEKISFCLPPSRQGAAWPCCRRRVPPPARGFPPNSAGIRAKEAVLSLSLPSSPSLSISVYSGNRNPSPPKIRRGRGLLPPLAVLVFLEASSSITRLPQERTGAGRVGSFRISSSSPSSADSRRGGFRAIQSSPHLLKPSTSISVSS